MASWIRTLLVILGAIVIAVILAIWIGSARWNRATALAVGRLDRRDDDVRPNRVSFDKLAGLPAPVDRYFRRVLKDGQPMIRSARLVHEGQFRSRPGDDGWTSMKAVEYFSADPPGFVWDADIGVAPMMNVNVRDAYLDGKGSMRAAVLSLVPVLDARDRRELDSGALQRFLAEAAWIPTALLPSDRLSWSPVDDTTAVAALTDGSRTVSVEFRFAKDGEITGVYTPARYREVNGAYEPTPWCGHWRTYEERNGMRIPLEAEVEWQLPEGNLPYWRARVTAVTYEFAP